MSYVVLQRGSYLEDREETEGSKDSWCECSTRAVVECSRERYGNESTGEVNSHGEDKNRRTVKHEYDVLVKFVVKGTFQSG